MIYVKVAAAVLLLAVALGAVQSDTDPYVSTPRYNKFPWSFKADYAFVFSVSPTLKPPTNPTSWLGKPEMPGFLPGSPGLLALLRYTDSPIGEYSELFYVPGSFFSPFCSDKALSSIHRIWVDSRYSQRAGRNIWGIPKELATFDWQETPSGVSVSVKGASGKVFFRVNTTEVPLPNPFTTVATSIAKMFVGDCITTIQYPIDDNTNRTAYANVMAYQTTEHANSVGSKVKLDVCFSLKGGVVAKVDAAFMDSQTFTGHKRKLHIGPLGYQFPTDMNATLGQPVPVTCWN